jgi:nucleotide-binding universal stress UspA family protein
MFKRILVPLDGSARAEQALPVAAKLAKASEGSLVLLRVVSQPVDYWGVLSQDPLTMEQVIEADLAGADSYMAGVVASADLAGITVKTEVTFGVPASHILATAESQRIDLIVMCSHGRTGFKRWALGSVAHEVVHHSPVPVLVLREGQASSLLSQTAAAHPLRAFVALDGSPLAEAALIPAANLVAAFALPGQRVLHLTHVVKLPAGASQEDVVHEVGERALEHIKAYLISVGRRLQEALKDLDLSISWSVALDTDIADALIRTVETEEEGKETEGLGGYSLIAMSTHGRGGVERWVMGSVTENVLNTTKLPLLIVRPLKVEHGWTSASPASRSF